MPPERSSGLDLIERLGRARRALDLRIPESRADLAWAVGLAFLYATIGAEFRAAPDVALAYWYLVSVPLIVAALRFGFRGALLGSVAGVLIIVQAFAGTQANAHTAAAVEGLIRASSSPDEAAALAIELADLRASDPRLLVGRALLGLVVSMVSCILLGQAVDRRNAADRHLARVTADVSRFCPPPVVRAIVEHGSDGNWQIAPARREITVLFADMRGFTALSENLEPEEIAQLLNEFFGAITDEVLRFGGTLDKYIGDAVMAFFGDPDPQPDHPERGFRAALAMQQRMRQLQVAWRAEGRPSAGMGIGLATGYATVGVTGSDSRLEYTAVGSVVNVAARLCELAQPGQILTTRKSYWRSRHLIDGLSRGPATVKGFSQPVEVVEVVGAHVRERQDSLQQDRHWAEVVGQIADDPSFRGLLLGNPEQVALTHNLGAREMELAEHLAVMVGSPVFTNVPPEEIATLTQAASLEHFERGAAVVQQGEDESRFYIILQGEVVVLVEDEEGQERHVGSLTRGDYFGEVALLFDMPRTATVRAISPLTVLVLRKDAFYTVLDRAPRLRDKIESAARSRATRSAQPAAAATPV